MDDDTVTLRDRDSLEQSRIAISELADELSRRLKEPWTSPKLGRGQDEGEAAAYSALPALAVAEPLLPGPGEVHRRLDDLLLRHPAVEVPPIGQRLHRTDHLLGDHLDELGQFREVKPLSLRLLAHQLDDRGRDLVAQAIEPHRDVGIARVPEHDAPGAAPFLDEAEERLHAGPHPRLARLGAGHRAADPL